MRRRTFLFVTAGAVAGSLRPGGFAQDGTRAQAAPGPLGTVAFTQRDGLWIRHLPDGPPKRLVSGTKIASPRFSPSGQWITCLQDDALHVVSIDGRQNLKPGEVNPGSVQPCSQWWTGRDELLVNGPAGVKVFTAAGGFRRASREHRLYGYHPRSHAGPQYTSPFGFDAGTRRRGRVGIGTPVR
jgi:hypothetical protein